MATEFDNTKIIHIVAFEHLKFKFNPEIINSLQTHTILNVFPLSVERVTLNKDIYSKIFVERYPKILNLIFEINLFDFIRNYNNKEKLDSHLKIFNWILENSSINNKVKIKICFDQIGVNSIRFDFKINKSLETKKLIKIANDTGKFVDEILFCEVKKNITELTKTKVNENSILKVHDTYTVIYSTDSNIDLNNDKKEIAGIISLNDYYSDFNDENVEKKTENEFSLYEGTLIAAGHSATLMIFNNPERFTNNPNNYINERISALEMYHRQKYLLKKLDVDLDNLIREFEENNDFNEISLLKEKMNKIKKTQIDIQSKLEIYRNTRTSITSSFILFFDILNNTFSLDKHYKFLLEKLDACDKIYQGLYDHTRTEFMEDIQFIVAILGVLSLIILMIDVGIDPDGLIQTILVLVFVIVVWILRKRIMKIFHYLQKELNNV